MRRLHAEAQLVLSGWEGRVAAGALRIDADADDFDALPGRE
jgi:hypothetical protein